MRRWNTWSCLVAAALALLLGACGGQGTDQSPGDGSSEGTAAAELAVDGARLQLLPDTGAVYFTVTNPGAEADRLLEIETPAGVAELHETVEEDGVMRMLSRLEGFEIPAGGELVLAPGGKHGMLMDVDVARGYETLPLSLRFERAGEVEVDATVESLATGGDHDGMDHGQMDHDEMDHGEMSESDG